MRKRQRILKKKESHARFAISFFTARSDQQYSYSKYISREKKRENIFCHANMFLSLSLSLFLSAYVPRNVVELKSRWQLKTDSVTNFFIIRRTNFPILLRARRANCTWEINPIRNKMRL